LARRLTIGTLVLLAAVIAAVVVLRDHGWLGGRAEGGPLKTAAAGIGVEVRPGTPVEWNSIDLQASGDEPVTIESVRVQPADRSPGLRLGAPRVYGYDERGGTAVTRPLDPAGGHPAAGAQIGGKRMLLAIPVTAPYAGVYELRDARIRYRRGHRHYETGAGGELSICARPRGARGCPPAGPDEGKGKLTAGEGFYDPGRFATAVPSEQGEGYRVRPAPGSRFRVRMTITNRTEEPLEIRRLRWAGLEGLRVRGVLSQRDPAKYRGPAALAPFRAFTVPPHDGRLVGFDLQARSCGALPQADTISGLAGPRAETSDGEIEVFLGEAFQVARPARGCPR
jgi:hypothetical protein